MARRTASAALRRVALAFPPGVAFLERLTRGIIDHATATGGWSFARMPEQFGASLNWLRHWSGDGAMAIITTAADARLARRLPFPVVNLAARLRLPGIATVMVDHAATGRLAAEHLLARRFVRFGYYGVRGPWFNDLRRDAFVATLAAAGHRCAVFEADLDATAALGRHELELERWIAGLVPPVGVLACTDPRAAMLLDACARRRLRVPEDVAVMGVDDDPVIAAFTRPTLTSIARNDLTVGRTAAELLDRLMAGAPIPAEPVLVPPAGVVERRSTATTAIEHPGLAAAVADIEAHLDQPFGVERILERLPLARRRVEALFHAHLGCTPYQFIARARVQRAQQMLASDRRASLTTVAKACGFNGLRHFRLLFTRVTGMSPRSWRMKTVAG